MAKRLYTLTGRNGVGDIAVAGVAAGDRILVGVDINNSPAPFLSIVITDGQLHQISGTDYSATTFYLILE